MANVVDSYDWTSIPAGSSLRANAPRVIVTEHKIKTSQALNRLTNYLSVMTGGATGGSAEQFYNDLYETTDGERFVFPFFGDAIRSFTNQFGDTFQSSFLGTIDSFANEAVKLQGEIASFNPAANAKQFYNDAQGALASATEKFKSGGMSGAAKDLMKSVTNIQGSTSPGSYIETPKLYEYARNDAPLEVSFVLSNTINEGSYEKNYDLVNKLTKINRPTRVSPLTMEPPSIYTVKLKGIRYIQWASCSNFSVTLLGAKKLIGGKIIPEGYMINMTFESLTVEVANFMDKIN